jgi:hypothetical protein
LDGARAETVATWMTFSLAMLVAAHYVPMATFMLGVGLGTYMLVDTVAAKLKKRRAAAQAGRSVPDWVVPRRLELALAESRGDYAYAILRDGAKIETMYSRSGGASKQRRLSVRFIRRVRPPMGPEEHADVAVTPANAGELAGLLEGALGRSPSGRPGLEVAAELAAELRSIASGRGAG